MKETSLQKSAIPEEQKIRDLENILIRDDVRDYVAEYSKQIGEHVIASVYDKSKSITTESNVAIFVDYDNVYWTLMNNYRHNPDNEDVEKNLFVKLWDSYGRDHVRIFKAYADFDKLRDQQLTSLQKKRIQIRHVYSNGVNVTHRKNSSDIELSIDAIETTYKDEKISTYVIVTADSDMIPLLSRLMYKGKRVELYYLSDSISQHTDLISYAHYSEDLLTFLNVDVSKEYNLDDYIVPALEYIEDWWNTYATSEYFLGKQYLRKNIETVTGLPAKSASALIEKINGTYIETIKKVSNGEEKDSVALKDEGKALLESFRSKDEVAPSDGN